MKKRSFTMAAPEKWLRIASMSGVTIIKRIYKAMKEANINKSDKMVECGLNFSDRLNMISLIFNLLIECEKKIYREIDGYSEDHVFTNEKKGYATKIPPKITYAFLFHLDALLFEMNSACELFKIFIYEFHTVSGNTLSGEKSTGKHISEILQKAGHDDSWFKRLDGIRNYFTHEGCPYFAVDITTEKYDILIMRNNLYDFNEEKDYYRLSELKEIYDHFKNYLDFMEKHMIFSIKQKQ